MARRINFLKSYVIEKILTGAHPGAIMLLHAVSDTDTKVLATVIKDLQIEGYEFKSLNDLPTRSLNLDMYIYNLPCLFFNKFQIL